jgi:hypothetical protein
VLYDINARRKENDLYDLQTSDTTWGYLRSISRRLLRATYWSKLITTQYLARVKGFIVALEQIFTAHHIVRALRGTHITDHVLDYEVLHVLSCDNTKSVLERHAKTNLSR